jgi:hypothetical protein
MGFLFLYALGILNCISLTIQLVLPTAPPWYIINYGETPAFYGIPSDPGRLVQIDDLFGITLFRGMYGSNPVVFGSFPSLHAAWPLLIALFSSDKVNLCQSVLVVQLTTLSRCWESGNGFM